MTSAMAFRDSTRLGSTNSHASDPTTQRAAATRKGEGQPKTLASTGVREAVTVPPIWLPMFITPETDPAERPAMSAVTDQKQLVERYSAPAPPASTMLATRASCARIANTMKPAASAMLTTETP